MTSEYTNPERWSCDMCVYYFPYETSLEHMDDRPVGRWFEPKRIGECRYSPRTYLVYRLDNWCGKFELNRAHPKAGFSELYKNEYNKEQKMFKYMLQYYTGEDE